MKERLREGVEKAMRQKGKAPAVIPRPSIARPRLERSTTQGESVPRKAKKDAPYNALLNEEIQEPKSSVNLIGKYLVPLEQAILSLQCYNPM